MTLYRDIERGGRLELDLKTNHKLKLSNGDDSKKVTVKLVFKRGNKYARLAIEAPEDVGVEVLPPDGVMIAEAGA